MCYLLARTLSGRMTLGEVIGLPIWSGGEKILFSCEGILLIKLFELPSKADMWFLKELRVVLSPCDARELAVTLLCTSDAI